MIIRLAQVKDNEHILKIWRACFSDDQAYIDNYLKYCLPYTKTWLLGLEEDLFVSCLSVIPSFTTFNKDIYRGGYLYAVGTLPEHRGNSYSKILINAAIKDCSLAGLSYMLVKPASESLYQFYIKSTFDVVISKGLSTFITASHVKPNENSIIASDINASELFLLQTVSFSDTHFLWPKEILSYALLEAKSRGGSCKKFQTNNEKSDHVLYYIAYPDDLNSNKIKVLETNAKNPVEVEALISVLKNEYPKIEETEIESSINFMESVSYTIERSALLLSFNEGLTNGLAKLHLSLPLE